MDHPEVTQAPEKDGFWDQHENRAWLQSQALVNEPEELPEEVSQFGFL